MPNDKPINKVEVSGPAENKDPLYEFTKNLLKTAKLIGEEPDEQDEISIQQLKTEVERHLILKSLDILDKAARKDYVELIAKGEPKPQEAYEFFKTHVPDFDKKQSEALKQFAINYIARTEKMRQAMNKED